MELHVAVNYSPIAIRIPWMLCSNMFVSYYPFLQSYDKPVKKQNKKRGSFCCYMTSSDC